MTNDEMKPARLALHGAMNAFYPELGVEGRLLRLGAPAGQALIGAQGYVLQQHRLAKPESTEGQGWTA